MAQSICLKSCFISENKKKSKFQFLPSLRCFLTQENLNSKFSASNPYMTITFDVLDQFQENKVWQTAQTMNNILKLNTKW